MLGSARPLFVLALLASSPQAFAQLTIDNGDASFAVGRVEWELRASGGTGGYVWSLGDGALPPGVVIRTDTPSWFDPTTTAGLIGIATTPGTYSFTLQVTDSASNVVTKPIAVTIQGLVMTSDSELADASVATPYSKTVTTAGETGSVSFTVPYGSLPAGLSLDSITGEIYGTPTTPGDYWFSVRLTDSVFSVDRSLHLYVSPLRVTSPVTLPNGTQGTPYEHALTVEGGTPYGFRLDCCAPGWLTLDSNTGVLSGTPTGPGQWGFTIDLWDASLTSWIRKHFQLGVVGVPETLPGLTNTIEDVSLGDFTTWNLNISGGTPPYTWAVTAGTLPPGLSVQNVPDPRPYSSVAGAWLVGTPTQAGVYSFTVAATDSSTPAVTTSHTYSVRVSPLAFNGVPNATYGVAYSNRIWILGGEPPYNVTRTNGTLPAGLTLDSTGLISGTPSETGYVWSEITVTDNGGSTVTHGLGFNVGIGAGSQIGIANGDLGPVTVNQNVNRNLDGWGGSGSFDWTLEPGSSLPPGLVLSGSPGSRAVLSGAPTVTGNYAFAVRAQDTANPANFGVRTFLITVTPLSWSGSTTLPWSNEGNAYSATLSVTGSTGSVAWSLESRQLLPDGLSLSSDGVLSGTLASAGQARFSVRAFDSGTGTSIVRTLNLAVYPSGANAALSITTGAGLGTWPIGRTQKELVAEGGTGTYSWSLVDGTLPPGISLRTDKPSWFPTQASAGLIGLATTAGDYAFTLQVASGSETVTRAFTMRITDLVILDPYTPPEAFSGQPYSYTFTSNVDPGLVIWSLSSGNPLPPGLTLDSAGVLSGTPSTAGYYNFNISVTDGVDTVSRGFAIVVNTIRVTTPRVLPNATQGAAYTFAFAAEGTSGDVTWTGDSTPTGLTLLPDGTLTGTTTQAASWTFNVTVTDSAARYLQTRCHLTVVGVPVLLPRLRLGWVDLSLGVDNYYGLSASHGTPPYTWSASGLPPGVVLRTEGFRVNSDPAGAVLLGTPTTLGTYSVNVTVTDSSTPPVTTSQVLTVNVTAMVRNNDPVPYVTLGQPYEMTLRTIGGALPYGWAVVGGLLPAGLALNPTTGVVSGTPIENTRQCPQIRVTDDAGSTYTRTDCLEIGGGTTTISIQTGWDLSNATQGYSYSRTFSAKGAPSYAWTVEEGSAAPPGLSLSAEGTLSGMPTTQGVYTFLIRATDAANSANFGVKQFLLNVTPLRLTSNYDLSYTNVGTAYSSTLTAAGNVGPVTWSATADGPLPPGMTLSSDGVLSGTPSSPGNYEFQIVWTDTLGGTSRTDWLRLPVYPAGVHPPLNLNPAPDLGTQTIGGQFSRDLSASGSPLASPGYAFSVIGSLPTGCALLTGDAMPGGTTAAARLACSPTSSGTFSAGIRVDDAAGNYGVTTYMFRVTPNVIFTSSSGLLDAATGTAYSQRLLAWGASQSWSLASGSALPPGLTLSSDGQLNGTPTATGSYSFALVVTDTSRLTTSRTFNLRVAAFAITDPRVIPVHAITGTPYTFTFTVVGGGGPKTFSLASGSLPTGITLFADGTLSGTTASTGQYTFVVQVTDGATTFARRFVLVARYKYPWPLTLAFRGQPIDAVLGQSLQFSLSPSPGVPPYTWSVAPGSSLPPGLTLLSEPNVPADYNPVVAVLAGTPTVAGSHTFTIRLADSVGHQTDRTYTLNVVTIDLVSNTPRVATMGTPYNQVITALGGTPPYTFSLVSGPLPKGLTLTSAGVLTGTPSNTGSWSITVGVSDVAGQTYSRGYAVSVSAPAGQTLNITNSSLMSDLSVGVGVTTTLSASGGTGAYTWHVDSGTLPTGLALMSGAALGLDPSRTYLAGRTQAPGMYEFTLGVSDSAGNVGYRTFWQRISLLRVHTGMPLTTGSLSSTVGASVTIQFTVVGGVPPHTFAVTPGTYLPPGLALSAAGLLSGTVSQSGTWSLPITVTDATGAGYAMSTSLIVFPASEPVPLIVGSSVSTSAASLDRAFVEMLMPSSGVAPFAYSLSTGALPPGMSLVPGSAKHGAYLLGAPAAAGTYSYGLDVSDSAAQTLSVAFTTTVSPLTLGPDALPLATVDTPYAAKFSPAGGTPPYSLEIAPNANLSPGLTLSGLTLAGVPAAPGRFTTTLTLRDSLGAQLTRTLPVFVDSLDTPVKALNASPSSVQVTSVLGETPALIPIAIGGGFASLSFTAAVAGIPGASLTVTSGTTPLSLGLLLPTGLALGTHYGVVEVRSSESFNARPLAIGVVVNVVAPPPCTYALSPSTAAISSGGGPGSVGVTSPSYCSWSASAAEPWITLTSSPNGTGNGVVSYSLSGNLGTLPRLGTVTVAGQTHSITQFGSVCAFTVDPVSLDAPASGGSATIAVNASLASCPWTAGTTAPWIEITSGGSGTGSGSVGISVAPNSAATPRSDSLTVAGLTVTVNQAAAGCMVSLSTGEIEMSSSGGTGSVDVTTNGCAYNTLDGPSWITVTSGGSGSGSGTLNYSVAPNSNTETRSGSLLIGGQPFRVTQSGVVCGFTVTSNASVFDSSGGAGTIGVAANGANCLWIASSGSNWLTITTGHSGAGNGAVTYSVSSNAATQNRSGAIVVAGQTVPITQAGITCSYALRSPSGTVPATGGTSSVGVMAAGACTWGATSDSPWLSITSVPGSGTADVVYAAEPNSAAEPRTGSLTIAGHVYEVSQDAAPCTYVLGTTSIVVGPGGASGAFAFTANQTGCAPAAVSFANWITASASVSGTNGTVRFTAAANPLSSSRSGAIRVGDQTFTVNQTAAACAFGLNAFGAIFSKIGGNGDVLASASALGCAPAVGASPEITLGPLDYDSGTRIYTQPYTVPIYESLMTWIRVLRISVSGDIFTIKQTSW